MATAVVLPKQGQSVESCIISSWKKGVGDTVTAGEILVEVETDKALIEIESPVSGTVLALFFNEGVDVPVLTHIAAIGEPGETFDALRPNGHATTPLAEPASPTTPSTPPTTILAVSEPPQNAAPVSPRAKHLAVREGINLALLPGSGPAGRIIERDVVAAIESKPVMTPLARSMVSHGGFEVPRRGSGVRGRVMADDLVAVPSQPAVSIASTAPAADAVEVIPVKGIRKVIATRMLESLQTTAQLTLNTTADATALLVYRQKLKHSAEALGVQGVTINDLLLFVVARILPQHPDLNALFDGEVISRYRAVHLAVAVDTPRGLMVPVIRQANTLSLKQIADEAKRLAMACLAGNIAPDELKGGTFTMTNLGNLGIESFTPVLNSPQVAILGVGSINLRPVSVDGAPSTGAPVDGRVQFVQHIGLSLTINHQVVDGAPAARFLQGVAQGVAQLDVLLAV